MQDKNLYDDRGDKIKPGEEENSENIIDDGVVYVVNEDGTPFDASDRTYVAVEGLDEALEQQDEEKDKKDE